MLIHLTSPISMLYNACRMHAAIHPFYLAPGSIFYDIRNAALCNSDCSDLRQLFLTLPVISCHSLL